ncbi:Casein kinase II subunit alpha [Aduncisulcus paluster]|uniref:non-specific serine/threonine protein kinase n=1 Tax=Aduncisulcus paluster TaxID=2918883 RepID=A0ABQ5KIB0_9EUKA|nr:Casein kinase II subunit alpha [Aduncisulcus paluster]
MNITYPKYYRDVCAHKEKLYTEYDQIELCTRSPSRYLLVRRIGKGKYSDAFLGIDSVREEYVVIKALKPVKDKRIKREAKVLALIRGGPHVVPLLDIIKCEGMRSIALVFKYVPTVDWPTFMVKVSYDDFVYYIYQLIKGLNYVHSQGIMHRDVKPLNLLIDERKKELTIIDFGLAEFYIPDVKNNVRVASRYFKAPELLVGYKNYSYNVDMWSVGCIMVGMMFQRDPFFKGKDTGMQLGLIVDYLGSKSLSDYLLKYDIPIEEKLTQKLSGREPVVWEDLGKGAPLPRPSSRIISPSSTSASSPMSSPRGKAFSLPLVTPQSLDLMKKLLLFDHDERLCTIDAMKHPMFDEIREKLGDKW